MDKIELKKEIIQNIFYPKKFTNTLVLKELSINEFALITCIRGYLKENGKHINVNELASLLGVTVPAVSKALKRLEERDVVEKECNENCRRNISVIVSPKGIELLEENQKMIEHILDKIMENLTCEEIEQSMSITKKICAIVTDACCELKQAANK